MQIRFSTKISAFYNRPLILGLICGIVLIFCISCLYCLGQGQSKNKRIALVIRPNFQGERSFAHRIQAACQNLHWKADIFEISKFKRIKRHPYDFVISLVPATYKFRKSKYYLAIFHPSHHYFGEDGALKTPYNQYDGYLLAYPPAPDEPNFIKQKLPYISWYPTVQKCEYKEVDPINLFHLGCTWGNRFEDPKIVRFLTLLDREAYTCTYGNRLIQKLCPQSYRAAVPFMSDSVCEIANSCGVTLILHSYEHNAHGIPSGRIFEAAAASTVIICDENLFVKKHFGDSVLYINTQENAESIRDQIAKHMDWIQSNKNAALEKAKRAHAIYKSRFLLEDQLLRLGAFHDLISKGLFSKLATKAGSLFRSCIRKTGGWFSIVNALAAPVPLTILPNIDRNYSLINSVDFHPKENVFCATYTNNNKISLYQITDGILSPHPIQTLCNPWAKLSEPQHAVFSPDGKTIVVANWTNQTFNVYKRNKKGLFHRSPAAIVAPPSFLQNCKPHGVAFSPCGNYLAVAYGASDNFEKAIALFHSQQNRLECISFLKDQGGSLPGTPKGISFSPDGTHLLVTFCEPSSIGIFQITNQTLDAVPKQLIQGANTQLSRPEDIKFSSDGSYCAVSNSDQNTVTFYHFDPNSNSIVESVPFQSLCNPESQLCFPHGIAFSSDGLYLAITQFGKVQITAQGDVFGEPNAQSTEASVNLYQLIPSKL